MLHHMIIPSFQLKKIILWNTEIFIMRKIRDICQKKWRKPQLDILYGYKDDFFRKYYNG